MPTTKCLGSRIMDTLPDNVFNNVVGLAVQQRVYYNGEIQYFHMARSLGWTPDVQSKGGLVECLNEAVAAHRDDDDREIRFAIAKDVISSIRLPLNDADKAHLFWKLSQWYVGYNTSTMRALELLSEAGLKFDGTYKNVKGVEVNLFDQMFNNLKERLGKDHEQIIDKGLQLSRLVQPTWRLIWYICHNMYNIRPAMRDEVYDKYWQRTAVAAEKVPAEDMPKVRDSLVEVINKAKPTRMKRETKKMLGKICAIGELMSVS